MDIWFTLFVFVVAIAAAVGFALVLVSYIAIVPATFAFGWRFALPTLFLPIAGPVWFAWRHWADFARAGKQMIIGTVLLITAAGLLYGMGPIFAARIMAGVK